MYIYQQRNWPHFYWDESQILNTLAALRHKQGRLIGKMSTLGFTLQEEAMLRTLTLEVLKTSEIEGEILDSDQVRSSIARRLGIESFGLVKADRDVEGVVEMLLDATQKYTEPLTKDRLFGWHSALFPTGRSGMYKITVGDWRGEGDGPMQVVSGPLGREHVHYEAPDYAVIDQEMEQFLDWFNREEPIDPVIKAAIAHLWFVTIHPFDDGNGRIARTIADLQLSRADESVQRFYSMSAQIRKERNRYYEILEKTQKGDLNVTEWLEWFMQCLDRAIVATDEVLSSVLTKAKYWEWFKSKSISERQKLMLNKLMDGFEGKLTTSKWAKIAKCSQDTALRDIQNLMEQGILNQDGPGGRSTSYYLAPVL
ncbi:cell filamentation protein Fic [Siphonobacter sp. SORGH_AS_0500]|uniref:Fic family protein n=1 Tax=Siphonobacter sp. SORGH_AS_0500 TaxID=1864824 RepID=UPI000CB19C42|nr:Fic family protein [Siphonobacter sp. SORGH_AS_0500]PKK35025.1 cell filamentation protein Fic [Siphonobacter sp. SORGH_AS_0500]